MLLVSLLLGVDHAGSALSLADDDLEVPPIPFEDAEKYLKGRVSLTKKEWNALEPKLRFRAFTVARLAQADTIEAVRQRLIGTLESGGSAADFWSDDEFQKIAGVAGSSPAYWENVFRTNIQTCYNTGRAMEFARNQPEYLEFMGIEDLRQTEICRVRTGIILPATHPWWKNNWAPLHYKCRSTIRGIYQEEADALRQAAPSWGPISDDLLPGINPAKGFGLNPLDTGSYWDITQGMVDRAEKFGMMPEIRSLADHLGLQSVRLNPVVPSAVRLTRVFQDSVSGGTLDVDQAHGASELDENLRAGMILAKDGKKVVLLPRSHELKSPDVLVDGVAWEIKTISKEKNKKGAVNGALKEGRKQASRIILNIEVAIDNDDLKNGIKGRIKASRSIQEVMVIMNGKISRFTRTEILAWK